MATAFDPPLERLAFAPQLDGEVTFDEVMPSPLPVVIEALTRRGTYAELLARLPDRGP